MLGGRRSAGDGRVLGRGGGGGGKLRRVERIGGSKERGAGLGGSLRKGSTGQTELGARQPVGGRRAQAGVVRGRQFLGRESMAGAKCAGRGCLAKAIGAQCSVPETRHYPSASDGVFHLYINNGHLDIFVGQ